MFRRADFLLILVLEKSWSKCKHAFRFKDATMDAHMLSLSTLAWGRLCDVLSAQETGGGMGYPPEQGHWDAADFSAVFLRIFA